MDLLNFATEGFQINQIVSKTITKGKFLHFKTGKNCQEKAIEKGDILLGVMPKEDGEEVLGFFEYKGNGCPRNSKNYNRLFNTQTK